MKDETPASVLRHAKKRILERFELGLYPSLADAVLANALLFGLSGSYDGGGMGRLWTLLEAESIPDSLHRWSAPRRASMTVPEALERLALGRHPSAAEALQRCDACGNHAMEETRLRVLEGHRVHDDLFCVSRILGPDHAIVLRVEAEIGGPRPKRSDVQRILAKRDGEWTWRCPCGAISPQPWFTRDLAESSAAGHLRGDPPHR